MTKMVLMADSWFFHLTDEHVEWLRKNGYPDANETFCCEDRSNPALIQCIESVRAAKAPIVAEAQKMYDEYNRCCFDMHEAQAEFTVKGEKFSAVARKIKRSGSHYIHGEVAQAIFQNKTWEQVCEIRFFASITEDDRKKLEPYFQSWKTTYQQNQGLFDQRNQARDRLDEYCEANSLRAGRSGIEIVDGYNISSYDETRFTADVVKQDDEAYSSCCNQYWEALKLTPFVTRATINSFVAKRDTDGLLDYLRSLHLDLNIEA